MLKEIIAWTKAQMYQLAKMGMSLFPTPGAVGFNVKNAKLDQQNAIRSQRRMKEIWGAQPHLIGARRADRTAQRLKKRAESFCNNLNADGNVVKN